MNHQIIKIFLVFLLISSCTEKEMKDVNEIKSSDPNHFVGNHKTVVSILGTFHFSNSTAHDYVDEYAVDGLSVEKQKELKILIEHLAKFRPTKILIEVERGLSDSLIDATYKNYLIKGTLPNENSEIYLIAFPLAKKSGLEKIHCSDASADWFGADLDWENFDEDEYLKSKGQYEKSYRYEYENSYKIQDSLKTTMSISDYLYYLNDPELQLFNHQIYLTETVLSGAGDNYIGADAVARWYRRNLRIFSNVLDITNFDKEERILLIYGASHVWTLKQFFEDSPDFEYVEIHQFLK